jgi:hypothetical protein
VAGAQRQGIVDFMLNKMINGWRFRRSLGAAIAADDAADRSKDVVLLPCWQRPEFLWHCIENLSQAEGIEDIHVIFRPDTGFAPDILDVIRTQGQRLASFEIQYPPVCPFRRTKQSANVLLGYLQAANQARQFVFLIEEDIMVARDFFRWHRNVHAQQPQLFCSIATKNHNREVTASPDADAYYRSTGDYCSWGVCMDRRVIQEWIAPHVNMSYFRKPKRYLRRHFPSSAVSLAFVEQDGLIRRIQEGSQQSLVYPCVPRAYHAGYYGYNRAGGVDGSLADKVRHIGSIIYSANAMRAAAANADYAADSIPVALTCGEWHVQRQVDVALCD